MVPYRGVYKSSPNQFISSSCEAPACKRGITQNKSVSSSLGVLKTLPLWWCCYSYTGLDH